MEHIKNPYTVYCETCPIRANCKPYSDTAKSYAFKFESMRASEFDCPLLKALTDKDRVYIEFDM